VFVSYVIRSSVRLFVCSTRCVVFVRSSSFGLRLEHKEQQDLTKEANNVHLLKKYGDALRNSVVKLGNDLLEVIPFFDNFER